MKLAVAGGTGVVGRHVVRAARDRGHDVVVVSRSEGIDLRSGAGLAHALDGVDVVIDVANATTMRRAEGAALFTEMTRHLHLAGAERGVSGLVTLSIVGLERVPLGYYQAKLAQEVAAKAGPLPATIVRATQFHEFPAQVLARARTGPVAFVPHMRIQPVAARALAEVLVDVVREAGAPQILNWGKGRPRSGCTGPAIFPAPAVGCPSRRVQESTSLSPR